MTTLIYCAVSVCIGAFLTYSYFKHLISKKIIINDTKVTVPELRAVPECTGLHTMHVKPKQIGIIVGTNIHFTSNSNDPILKNKTFKGKHVLLLGQGEYEFSVLEGYCLKPSSNPNFLIEFGRLIITARQLVGYQIDAFVPQRTRNQLGLR